MEKTALYLSYFCIYSLILLVIGKSSMRGPCTPRDYFICDRKVSLPLCVCTFTGTWVSAITILSLTGSVYEDGLAVLFYSVIPWFLGAFLLALITKRLYQSEAITVPELFRLRFRSRSLQCFFGAVLIPVYLFYLVAQYKGFGMVASALFRIPYPVAVCMVCLFITYTTIGGYRSVLRTDVFNLILLSLSLIFVCACLVRMCGGFRALYEGAANISSPARPGLPAAAGRGQLLRLFGGRYTPLISLSMFWGWGLGLASNPQYLVRLLNARDQRTAVRTISCSLLILGVLYFALVHIGLAMRVLVPELPEALGTDEIFIHLINHELYGPWSGFFFFSVIGACISTANSQLLLIASSFSYDLLRPLSGDRMSGRQVVSAARASVAAASLIVMLLTLSPPPFTLSYGGDLWGVVAILFFPPLYGSLLSKRVTLRGVRWSVAVGCASIAFLYPLHALSRFSVHPAMIGVLLSFSALLLGSAASPGPKAAAADLPPGTETADAASPGPGAEAAPRPAAKTFPAEEKRGEVS